MPPRPLIVADRILFAAFALLLTAATVVAAREILFALPPCPDGGTACPAVDAHWTGSRLVAMTLAVLWLVTAAWWYIARWARNHGRGGAWLAAFWIVPIVIVLAAAALLVG